MLPWRKSAAGVGDANAQRCRRVVRNGWMSESSVRRTRRCRSMDSAPGILASLLPTPALGRIRRATEPREVAAAAHQTSTVRNCMAVFACGRVVNSSRSASPSPSISAVASPALIVAQPLDSSCALSDQEPEAFREQEALREELERYKMLLEDVRQPDAVSQMAAQQVGDNSKTVAEANRNESVSLVGYAPPSPLDIPSPAGLMSSKRLCRPRSRSRSSSQSPWLLSFGGFDEEAPVGDLDARWSSAKGVADAVFASTMIPDTPNCRMSPDYRKAIDTPSTRASFSSGASCSIDHFSDGSLSPFPEGWSPGVPTSERFQEAQSLLSQMFTPSPEKRVGGRPNPLHGRSRRRHGSAPPYVATAWAEPETQRGSFRRLSGQRAQLPSRCRLLSHESRSHDVQDMAVTPSFRDGSTAASSASVAETQRQRSVGSVATTPSETMPELYDGPLDVEFCQILTAALADSPRASPNSVFGLNSTSSRLEDTRADFVSDSPWAVPVTEREANGQLLDAQFYDNSKEGMQLPRGIGIDDGASMPLSPQLCFTFGRIPKELRAHSLCTGSTPVSQVMTEHSCDASGSGLAAVEEMLDFPDDACMSEQNFDIGDTTAQFSDAMRGNGSIQSNDFIRPYPDTTTQSLAIDLASAAVMVDNRSFCDVDVCGSLGNVHGGGLIAGSHGDALRHSDEPLHGATPLLSTSSAAENPYNTSFQALLELERSLPECDHNAHELLPTVFEGALREKSERLVANMSECGTYGAVILQMCGEAVSSSAHNGSLLDEVLAAVCELASPNLGSGQDPPDQNRIAAGANGSAALHTQRSGSFSEDTEEMCEVSDITEGSLAVYSL